MSPLFKGSVVLTRDAIGASKTSRPDGNLTDPSRQHTSFSGTSLCTYKAAREYFRDGVLPKPGTICGDITDQLFGNKTTTPTTKRAFGHGELEERMLDAGRVLSEARFTRSFGRSV
jgi:hypothetical protein